MENENKDIQEVSTYDFGIIDIIKKGWVAMDGVKVQFMIAFVLYVIVMLIVGVILSTIFPQGTEENPNFLNQMIVNLLSIPVTVPLFAGMYMMAIQHVRGEVVSFKSLFNYYHLVGILSLATILIYIMLMVGFMLLIIPGIYLSIAYVFVLPLITDKGMGIWEAMEYSRKKVTQHWFKVFGLGLLLGVIVLAGIIPMGIGLIWAMPLLFITYYGLLYRLIFDAKEV